MADAAPTFDFSDHPFALKRCAVCGYDLAGVARLPRCPECGQEYDPLTLQVWGKTNKYGFLKFMGSILWLNAAGIGVPALYGFYGKTAAITGASLVIIARILSSVLRRLVYKRRYGTTDGRGQFIMNPSGAAVRNGYGQFQLHSWIHFPSVTLVAMPGVKLWRRASGRRTWSLGLQCEGIPFGTQGDQLVGARTDHTERGGTPMSSVKIPRVLQLFFIATDEDAHALKYAAQALQQADRTRRWRDEANATPDAPD